MQIMEQIRHAPGSAKVIARSVAVRKSLFVLTASLCVLLLLIGNGETAEGEGTENATENLAFSGRVINNNGDPVGDAEILYAVNWRTTQLVTRTVTDGTFALIYRVPSLGSRVVAWTSSLNTTITQTGGGNCLSKTRRILRFNSTRRGMSPDEY